MELFSGKEAEKAYRFHRSMGEQYVRTPLVRLDALAAQTGLGRLFVKDESRRGPQKAFKMLGGVYAVAGCICRILGARTEEVSFDYLCSAEVKKQLGSLVFAAASDGNHGKSVAWAARAFGHSSVVYMPKGTARERVEAIENLGGTVVVCGCNYDGCVREVSRLAAEKGWVPVFDTAARDGAQTAKWAMQGYCTMAAETIRQLRGAVPTHVFLQAGVGSMAAAVTGVLANRYGGRCPKIYTLEPHRAACFFESGLAGDGSARIVEGDLDSMMAGLSCGVPNPVAWDILRNFADGFFSCDDVLAANGMRILGNPLPGDERVVAGESGAVGAGFIEYMTRREKTLSKEIGLDKDSAVLVFNTEGDTDARNYREVVWFGKNAK